MPHWEGKRGLTVVSACMSASGTPDFALNRVEVTRVREMDELRCVVEPRAGAPAGLAERVATAIRRDLGIRCAVEAVAPGTLPRFEMKAKRFSRREEART